MSQARPRLGQPAQAGGAAARASGLGDRASRARRRAARGRGDVRGERAHQGPLRTPARAATTRGRSARTRGSRRRLSTARRASQSARWAAGGPVGRMLEALAWRDRPTRPLRLRPRRDRPGRREVVARGTLDGTIAAEASGSEGFGFDPVFVPEGETRTVAQLGNGWKAEHSHRARAAARLARRSSVAASSSPPPRVSVRPYART